MDNDLAILDTLKVCDTVLFVISAVAGYDFGDELIDQWGNKVLTLSFAQGLPTPVVAVTDLDGVPQKKRGEQKHHIQKLVSKWMPDEKIMTLDKSSDALNVLRKIGNQKHKSVINRDRRPHLYAEECEFVNGEGSLGTLMVTGHLRGTPLSANDLIHLPGLGDFQISQIDAIPEPQSAEKVAGTGVGVARVLERADITKQESLVSENIVDPMDAEQTWPTEEELKMAEESHKTRKVKKVPKGWSDYQAAWIVDEDDESVSSDDEEDDLENMDAMSEVKSDVDEGEEFDTLTESEIGVDDQQYDKELDLDQEKEELEKLQAAKSDLIFPDEMDTPLNVEARVRFQKYRGLESFRTSPWDVKENLPVDYGRIFQFENFDRTKRKIVKSIDCKDGVMPGWYIRIHIKDVSQHLWATFQQTKAPLILFGLLQHEHKMSVMNTVLKRTPLYEAPIKSKERLIFQCGYRRFIVNPIYSEHTNGKKHKYERYFQPNSTVVASFYAPIQFPPAPTLCFKEVSNKLVLVAHGQLLSCNPDRLIIKRIVLSGHPLKINKRSAVVRFMFFNREDIIYFKPVKLHTKYGRIGHIKEPLGTHGHMKCVFDGQLKSMDTVVLNLYKRIFPKWTFEECIVSCSNVQDMVH
uniref:Pre-rRNA-processing protein TSR1 homolog n=3 Tax=Photinus pyralis TaxID=7054 RepID=A0A1Y1N7A1_PHOPY